MKLLVTGCNGRMGAQVTHHAANLTAAVTLIGGSVRRDDLVGIDIGELAAIKSLGVAATPLSALDFAIADAVIDFTLPQGLMQLLPYCLQHKVALITGTTGLDAAQQAQIDEAAKQIPIVQSYNMSLGVNLLAALVEKAAATLDESFDIEIVETHHRHKKDAPSGTAILLGEAAAKARQVSLADKQVIDRDGMRQSGDIGFAVLRAGGVVGDHTVMMAGESERIELTHKGHDRSIYAQGALKAAQWLVGKPAGLYSMRDVLGLNT